MSKEREGGGLNSEGTVQQLRGSRATRTYDAGHAVHAVAPDAAYVLTSHVEQDDAPESEKEPGLHVEQDDAPDTEYDPGLHVEQEDPLQY